MIFQCFTLKIKTLALLSILFVSSISHALVGGFYPDIAGQQLSSIETSLSNLGIKLTINKVDSPVKKGQIITQIPPANTPLGQTAHMYLVVANGLVIPQVSKKNIDTTKTELEKLGFSVEISHHPIEGVANGNIAFLTPEPGTRIDPKSEAVFLIVSSAELVRVPLNIINKEVWEVREDDKIRFTTSVNKLTYNSCIVPHILKEYVTSSFPLPGELVTIGSEVKLITRTVVSNERAGWCPSPADTDPRKHYEDFINPRAID